MTSINGILMLLLWFARGSNWYGSSFIHSRSNLNQTLQ